MTGAELTAWRTRHGLTMEQAAALVGLSLRGWQGQAYQQRPVSRQTELLTVRMDRLLELAIALDLPHEEWLATMLAETEEYERRTAGDAT